MTPSAPTPSPSLTADVVFVDAIRLFAGAEVGFLSAGAGLRERGWRVGCVAAPGSELARRARAAGWPVAEIPIRCDAAPWTLARLLAVWRRWRPRAVICNRLKDLKAAGVAARLAGVPAVWLSRESDFPLRRGRPYYRWYLNRVATGVLVNSRATRETTLRSAPWLDPARVHLWPKGVDTARFRPAPFPEAPTVGFVGRLDARKGLPLLLAAWERLERYRWRRPPRLLIAGDGPWRDRLRRWRDRRPAPERVELAGWTDDVPALLARTTVLAVPSRYEGFGLAAAEAQAAGRPVVAAAASSLPEIVLHAQTGLLVPAPRPALWAAALARVLVDPALADRLGRAGRERIVARFSRERMLDRLEELLHAAGVERGGAP